MELADKIRAAIDETEGIARACGATDWRMPGDWQIVDRDTDGWQSAPDRAVIFSVHDDRDAEAIHAINNDPDRVLRRCAADRKILELHRQEPHCDDLTVCRICAAGRNHELWVIWPCDTVLALAEGYGIEP